jgi:MFS family permease
MMFQPMAEINADTIHDAGARRSWVVAAALFVSLFLLWGSCFNTFGVFFMPLVKEFRQSHASIALLSTIIVLLAGAVGPLAGWLLERIGARLVMGIGAALSGVGLVGISQAHSFVQILMWYVVLGIGLGASTWLPASIVITNWFTERPGTALGLITAGMELGGMLMTLLAANVIQHDGWRRAYLVLAIPIFIIAVPLLIRFVELSPDRVGRIEGGGIGGHEKSLDFGQAVRTSSFWLAGAALFAYGFGVGGSFVHLVPYLTNAGYVERRAALALSLSLGLMVLGKPTMGMLGDRFGARQMLSAGWLICGISTLLMLEARRPELLITAVLLYGLTLATAVALLPVVLRETFGAQSLGTVMGWLIVFQTLGIASGPVLSGKLFDLSGSYTTAFAISGVVIVVAAGLMSGVVRREAVPAAVPAYAKSYHHQ